jgi:hypothetical protein
MKRLILLAAGGLVVLAAAGVSRRLAGPASVAVFEASNKPAEAARYVRGAARSLTSKPSSRKQPIRSLKPGS